MGFESREGRGDWYDYRRRRTPANCPHVNSRSARRSGRVTETCIDCGNVLRDARTRGRKIGKGCAA